ncbi:Uncharacterised protein [Klebsiella pneumoniae]|nr:Uncharacterised protein [Klebsiella pneumoniae]
MNPPKRRVFAFLHPDSSSNSVLSPAAWRRCACADLRCLNLWRTRRPDKAFMPPSGTTASTVSDVYRPAALRLRGPTLFEPAKGLVGRIRHLCRHPAQPQVRRLMCITRRRCACAGLRCLNLWRTRRPDKAFMPPSGTTAGTVSDVYRPAALRLRGPTLFEPAKGLVGRIRRSRQANVVKKGITRRPFSLCRAA